MKYYFYLSVPQRQLEKTNTPSANDTVVKLISVSYRHAVLLINNSISTFIVVGANLRITAIKINEMYNC